MDFRWEIEEQLATSATDIDPEGMDFGSLADLYVPRNDGAKQYMDELYDDEVYGDPVRQAPAIHRSTFPPPPTPCVRSSKLFSSQALFLPVTLGALAFLPFVCQSVSATILRGWAFGGLVLLPGDVPSRISGEGRSCQWSVFGVFRSSM